jgi:hypothetical protein
MAIVIPRFVKSSVCGALASGLVGASFFAVLYVSADLENFKLSSMEKVIHTVSALT